jgi:tricorn protease
MRKRFRLGWADVFAAMLCAFVALVAPAAGAAEGSLWLRDPAISPDGSRIAFRLGDQIWIAPTTGGVATPLTPAGMRATHPVWSPAGDKIAFACDRFGPMNIFVAPAGGGEAQRLTWYASSEVPFSFTPDGAMILFGSDRLGDATQTFAIPNGSEHGEQLWQVPAAGGRDTLALPNAAFAARWNRDKTRLLYTAPSIEQPYRARQTSSAARHVWLYDAATGRHERLLDDVHEDRDAVWSASGDVYYLGEASGSLNVWRVGLADRKPVQITHFTGAPVRSLSISDGGDLAFLQGGDVYRLRDGAAAPERIEVSAPRVAFPGDRPERATRIDDFALSPNGREIAVTSRGQIYVASMNGRYVKRITHDASEARSPNFAPDGRSLAYAAERDGRWSLFVARAAAPDERMLSEATVIEEKPLRSGDGDAMWPSWSPDGKHVAYLANRESLRVLDVAAKTEVEVMPKGRIFPYADAWPWPIAWSPDSKWIATLTQPSEFIGNVAVVPADGAGPVIRVAPSGEDQWYAQWSADGGMLLWANDADSLREAHNGEWAAEIAGVYASRAALEAFRAKLREPVVAGADADARAEPADERAPAAKPVKREPFAFEPEGLEDRRLTFSQGPTHLVYWGMLADGVSVLQVERTPSADGMSFTATGTVRDLRLGQRRTLFSGLAFQALNAGGDFVDSPVQMSRDRKKLYFIARGADNTTDGITEVDVAKGTNRLIKITMDASRDEAEARAAAFAQFWTLTKKKFFDLEFNGVDWDAARARYARFLPSIVDSSELAELLSEMSGELAASHTGAFFRATIPLSERTASLGLYYDERYPGPGVKVAAVLAGGPFDTADGALKPGDILRRIDGEDIPDSGGIRRALQGRAGQLVAVAGEHADGSAFTEKRVTVNLQREFALARQRWKKAKREATLAKSCGHVGYVYVDAMDARSYREVFSDIFGRFGDADALVVDIRYNGGGNLHNHLLTLLSGKPYATWTPPRGGPSQLEPRDRWTKPSVVIMNAASYSDASVFPHAYRDAKLGPLVGDPVAGTGTAVWWADSNIIPGLVYGLPQLPLREIGGKRFENDEIAPDIGVASDPTAWDKGEDPQLDAAIQAAMPKGVACPGGP